MKVEQFAVLYCAVRIATGIAFAADPNAPTVIKPTSGARNGIAPNGITATSTGVFFTQPFTDGLQVHRGVYTISIPGGAVSNINTIPSGTPPTTAENSVAIVASPAGSGFIPGDVYATGVSTTNNTRNTQDAIYKNGSLTPFIDGRNATDSKHQIDVTFDTVGSFNGALIVTNDSDIGLYNSTGTLLASYTGPSGFVLQRATVAPLSYALCPGCIFVTAMPIGNINNPFPIGAGEILTVSPGAASGSAAVLFATLTDIPEPESINFVTAGSLSCTVGGFTLFASGYADHTQFNNRLSTTGAILAWTPDQLSLAGVVGHYLVQGEEHSGGGPGVIFMDAGLPTQTLFSDTTGPGNNGYQLEDTAIVQCTACVIPASGTAIPGSPVSWNGFSAPAGSVVWINAHIGKPSGVPTNTITTVDFTSVSLVVNATTYALPNGHIVFDPAISTPTTVVNADGSWTTTLNPSNLFDEIFFDGQAIPVDSNLENGGHGNTGSTLSFTTNSSDTALSFKWQWSAAVYTSWPGNAAANIEAVHAAQHAGAPLNAKDLIQGPRGGGGSNFTGSWSGTGQGTCPQ